MAQVPTETTHTHKLHVVAIFLQRRDEDVTKTNTKVYKNKKEKITEEKKKAKKEEEEEKEETNG